MKEDCPCFTDLVSLNSGVLHPFFGVRYHKYAVEIQTQVVQASYTEISKLVHILFKGLHLSYTDKIVAHPEKQFIPGLCSVLLQTPQSNRKGNRATRLPWLCLPTS